MMLIKIQDGHYDLSEYKAYLRSVQASLPVNARAFALYPEHYDIENDKCLYDSWVESFVVQEIASGERGQVRQLEISVRLLGPAHDGYHEIEYKDVQKYSLQLDRVRRKEARVGHGDWIVDEVLLDSSGFVSHEVHFSESGRWYILSADIVHRWSPKSS